MKLFKLKPKKWDSNWDSNWEFVVRSTNESGARTLIKNATNKTTWNNQNGNNQAWDSAAWLDETQTVCDLWNDDRFALNGKEEILWPEEKQWEQWDLWTKWS